MGLLGYLKTFDARVFEIFQYVIAKSTSRSGKERYIKSVDKYEISARFLGVLVPIVLLLTLSYELWVYIALVCVSTLIKKRPRNTQDNLDQISSRSYATGWVFLAVNILLLFWALSFTIAIATTSRQSQLVDKKKWSLEIAQKYQAFECDPLGNVKFCSTCQAYKPDRSHHSREVGACVLKQDHYCPFIGGNVCFQTQKLFVQFLTSALIYCAYVAISTSVILGLADHQNWQPRLRGCWISIIVISAFFGIVLTGLCCGHWRFILTNTNSFEAQGNRFYLLSVLASQDTEQRAVISTQEGDKIWDLGPIKNFLQVMGPNVFYWILPLKYTFGSGYSFPFNPELLSHWQGLAKLMIQNSKGNKSN